MRLSLLLLLSISLAGYARIHSLPEDTYAFPKYRVTFLNSLPIHHEAAHKWLRNGLRGGEQEFLDQPWNDQVHTTTTYRKEIGAGDTSADTPASTDPLLFTGANYTLELMRMGPKDSYVCLIPKPSENASARQQDESESELTPARSWSLLQPLSGTCLYHRQGWFTYSYCHNKEIRQFKELVHPQGRLPAGTYKPEEDAEYNAYTLGRAPRSSEDPGADLTVAERNAHAANLELARNAGSRYLVQRWGDGTICDMTGKRREVEVQFHCSMVMTDHILFVKETKTCSYVLVIHTPRLCGEPGFRSRRDSGEESLIRCREVVDGTKSPVGPGGKQIPLSSLPTTPDHPLKIPRRKTVLPAQVSTPNKDTKAAAAKDSSTEERSSGKTKEQLYNDFLKKTLEALMDAGVDGDDEGVRASLPKGFKSSYEDGELVVEFVEDDDDLDSPPSDTSNRIVEALKAVGYDARAEVIPPSKLREGKQEKGAAKKDKSEKKESKGGRKPPKHIEL